MKFQSPEPTCHREAARYAADYWTVIRGAEAAAGDGVPGEWVDYPYGSRFVTEGRTGNGDASERRVHTPGVKWLWLVVSEGPRPRHRNPGNMAPLSTKELK